MSSAVIRVRHFFRRPGLVIFLSVLGIAILFFAFLPFFEEDLYRGTLEAGFSAALGRTVKLDGPINLDLSLRPSLVLENFRVANPPWASRPNLIHANRLEAQVSLLSILLRKVEIEKIFLDGVDLHLEDGPDGSNNWTFNREPRPTLSLNDESSTPIFLSETGFIAIQRVKILYKSSSSEAPFQMTIIEGSIEKFDDGPRKISIRGTFHDVLFTSELTAGNILDLGKLNQPWPIEGVVSAAGTSLIVKGKVRGKDPRQLLDVNITLKGNTLSSLNPFLGTDLPSLGPYELAGALRVTDSDYSLKNVRARIGQSDFAGDVILGTKASRPWVSATLKSNSFQIDDFRSAESDLRRVGTDPLAESFTIPVDALRAMDAHIALSVNTLLLGDRNFGAISLNTTLDGGLLSIAPFNAESLGGTVSGIMELNVNGPTPSATFEAKGKSIDYGQALDLLGITNEIAGSTDFDLTLSGKGITLHEFQDHIKLRMNAGPTTVTFGKNTSNDPLLIDLRRAALTVSENKPVKVNLDGNFRHRPFKARFTMGTLTSLNSPSQLWPVSLLARMGDASLIAKGGLGFDSQGMRGALSVTLKGNQLNRLDPDLPPKGPYSLAVKLTKEGDQYTVTELKGRLAGTDIAGSMTLDVAKPRPFLTGTLTSQQLNVADLSTPGDVTIPVQALQAIDAGLNLTIKRMTMGAVHLADLDWRVSLQEGRLVVPVEGKLVNKEDVYGEWEGGVGLDTTETVPVLSGRMSVQTLKIGQLLQNLELKPHIDGTANLEVEFSGEGPTIGTILTHSTFKVEGKDVSVMLPGDRPQNERTLVITQAEASVIKGGPLQLTAEGSLNDTPFTMASSSDKLVALLEETGDWSLDLSLSAPKVLVDLKGHIHLPFNGEDFSFQTLVKSERLSDLNFLSATPLPELGPFRVTGLLTQTKAGFSLDEFQGTLAESDVSGSVALITTGLRPHVIAKLESNTIDIPSRAQMGQSADAQEEPLEASDPDEARVFPDVTFPVTTLRAWDVDLNWHVKHVEAPAIELDDMTVMAKLEDGLFTLAPLKGTSWGGQVEINLELDVAGMIPTLALKATSVNLDLGRMLTTLQATDRIATDEGRFLIKIKGRGYTLGEVLSRANGEIDIIEGPFEIRTNSIDLWARGLMIEAFTSRWKKKEITKFNCAVGYFDVENGIMKSDAILIDTSRLTIAAIGGLNLGTENIDLVATPRSKNPTLFSMTHPVRLTGKLADPDVSNDPFHIAKSEGWTLLGLQNPLDALIAIPGFLGTSLGTREHNPCVIAMKDKHLTAKKVKKLNTGFLDKVKNFFTNLGSSADTPPEDE